MADYTDSKDSVGGQYPLNANEAAWNRLEPLVSAQKLRSRQLWGIPLRSQWPDPVTGQRAELSDDDLLDAIQDAVSVVEEELGVILMPTQLKEKHPFDAHLYAHYGHLQLRQRPVASIQALQVMPPSGTSIYTVPLDWIETAYLVTGQINLLPVGVSVQGAVGAAAIDGLGAAVFLTILGKQGWTPAFWQVTYTTGFKDGMLPRPVNDLIGCVAGIELLSRLAATNSNNTSQSTGIDNVSQSVSSPGPQLFSERIKDLTEKRQLLVKKLKKKFGGGIISGTI